MQYKIDDITFIYDTPQLESVFEQIKQAAQCDSTVLITGESGTGKGLAAKLLHSLSPRCQKTYVPISCPALSDTLIESELFGHEKGAFTGAEATRIGRFESADKGTVVLDEVSEINSNFQCKLLRLLDEKSFERVGGNMTKKVDVRIVATSNRNLIEMARSGHFREDLYYRLSVIPIHLPALRDHKEDIIPLIHHYITYKLSPGRKTKEIHKDTFQLLQKYCWPGNVRELFNIVERMMTVVGDDVIMPSHISGWLNGEAKPDGHPELVGQTIDDIEKEVIQQNLEHFGGNRRMTAEALKISEKTLRNKIGHYGLRV
ncbi:MAG: sigma-54 dependent transcriptional regulator [Candidatus Brocadiia bacterium]